MEVIKRDGRKVKFDKKKIDKAIDKAFKEVRGVPCPDASVLSSVSLRIKNQYMDRVEVEQIQDIVEQVLMEKGYYNVAKAYIKYRYDHELARRDKKEAEYNQKIEEKLTASNVQNQNANVDEHSFGGRMGEVNSEIMRQYALDHLLSPMAKANHLNNEIYIHDLDHYAVGDHNCLSVPFDKLLANGFNTRQTDVRPANSINTAFQLVAVIFQLQSLMEFGGVSATHLDWTMVPYVRKSFNKHFKDGLIWCENITKTENSLWPDDLSINDTKYKQYKRAYQYAMAQTEKECHQAIEGMYHNLNTLQSRSGNQLEEKMAG